MATLVNPVDQRPNVATANIQLPAVESYEQVDRDIAGTLVPTKGWFALLGISTALFLWGAGTWVYQIYWGLGNAGYNPPVMWGVYIISFVFWVGIGHAGTLISAILYLFRAGFRTTIYRCAEAMTVFAVMTAGLFPIIHIGRPWKFFWLVPYPNWRLIWPNFKSPLVWDVFAISTYLTVSATFLYVGLIPDLAVLRDRATNPVKKRILAVMSLGWRNSEPEWRHFARMYLFLAAFSTPLVLSVHSVVSFDFAMAVTPGWHATIFPPYFVAGAIFSGIGMVFTIIIPIRKFFRLQHIVTINHLDAAAKLALFTSMVVGCAYLIEFWVAWYSANEFEQAYFWNRVFGQWWWAAWIMLSCNMIFPLSLFSQRLRRNPTWLFILSILINIGMWYERFVIIVPSLSHEFEPWQWSGYIPSWVDVSILAGSFGWFFMWFLLFIKNLPVIAIAEVKEIIPPRLRTHAAVADIDVTGHHVDYSPETPGGTRMTRGLIAAYRELDALVDAIEALQHRKFTKFTVYTPTPRHEIDHALKPPTSKIRLFTLIGGLCGVTFGYWIAIWTSDYWPMVVGGKAIASWIPYTIIGFEVMVLVGALSTVYGMFILSRVPKITQTIGFDPRFTGGDFGIYVETTPERLKEAEAALREAGAVEVTNER